MTVASRTWDVGQDQDWIADLDAPAFDAAVNAADTCAGLPWLEDFETSLPSRRWFIQSARVFDAGD